MKTFLVLIVLSISSSIHTSAQIEKFVYQPDKVNIGKVYKYKKSNQDGSNPHWVATYIIDETRMESLKWTEGQPGVTMVEAEIDWTSFSVKKFVGGRIAPDGQRIVGGKLDQLDNAGRYQVNFGEVQDTMQIDFFPWHSYDFDFASLNLIWPHLKTIKSNFTINIADVVVSEGKPQFVNKGLVEIIYQGEEKHNGVECLKYAIDGPGLENRGGVIWLSKTGQYFVEYLIDLPDESSFKNMKFSFNTIEKMETKEWETFKLKKAKGG